MNRSETGREWLIAVVIGGGGIALGLALQPVLVIAIVAAAIGIVLNAYLLTRFAVAAGKVDKVPLAILMAIPAGLLDALKVFALALVIHWLVAPTLQWIHVALLIPAFLIVLNGFLRGSAKAQIDAVLGGIWIGLLVLAVIMDGWIPGLRLLALSFVYALAFRLLASEVAKKAIASV